MIDCEFKNFQFRRRDTHQIRIGGVPIGGGAPIVVQSMTKSHTQDVADTIKQIRRMEDAGCEIVRLAVPDEDAVRALRKIKKSVSSPIIADIHFDHTLALAALRKGVDALRINPGNIGSRKKVREVVRAAKDHSVPIRIGVNSGSLEKSLLRKHNGATPEAMVESAIKHIRILEDLDFDLIKISLKASDVTRTVKAYELLADKVDYPFHSGITEAGGLLSGTVKSSVGLALLIQQGLSGDDIIREVHRQVFGLDITEESRLMLIDRIGEFEFRLNQGGSDDIQLEALLAQFLKAKK